MGGKDSNYQIVYRGETLQCLKPGQYVFFQRLKEYGGGFWLGKTYEDGFEFVLEWPTSLSEGLLYLMSLERMEANYLEFVNDIDDFKLT
ncbi:hypothetical protein BZH78_19280 [Salmonella enterica]|uniref:hypothetical protein n=1 Tax=Cronobacter TaxID=413496 RepID=UPI0009BC6D25|nr:MULTISPECIES: hypothetical protein [Cronobacter]EAU0361833.1 hypothetical protein [Salmonella enterica]EBM7745711.1 hypothetical protein [Salmonella enterica subsp. enterica serovar Kentucky]EAZ2237981.1 hypothetical protein [Salmonella enterica]ECU5713553.1 hypothetical protein [Salmonella enterica subsp. enterica serovar Kentucky]EDZ9412339.1 hypothetical protein [Salmonella enterica subsp. enterica serovar Kentucky]